MIVQIYLYNTWITNLETTEFSLHYLNVYVLINSQTVLYVYLRFYPLMMKDHIVSLKSWCIIYRNEILSVLRTKIKHIQSIDVAFNME